MGSDERFKINVPYYSQRDNRYAPYISCYPTSMGMAMAYCLSLKKLDKTAIGCDYDMQIEDYINKITMSDEIQKWLKKNQNILGKWIWKFKPRTIAYVEEHIFNKLMNKHGFECVFRTDISFEDYCNIIEREQLPQIVHGKFTPETSVRGHIICGIGFDRMNQRIIAHDPYGDAREKYKIHTGADVEYDFNHWFIKNKKHKSMWLTSIMKI